MLFSLLENNQIITKRQAKSSSFNTLLIRKSRKEMPPPKKWRKKRFKQVSSDLTKENCALALSGRSLSPVRVVFHWRLRSCHSQTFYVSHLYCAPQDKPSTHPRGVEPPHHIQFPKCDRLFGDSNPEPFAGQLPTSVCLNRVLHY